MNTCRQLKESLVTAGREGIEKNADLTEHLQSCNECQQLLRAWEQIPNLLQQLPEYEPDQALTEKVSQGLAAANRNTTASRRRFLAPSLASAAILLAAIGLSRELLLHEAPKAPVTINTHAAPVQSAGGPKTPSPAGGFDDAEGNFEAPATEQGERQESPVYRANQSPRFAGQYQIAERETLDEVTNNSALSGGDTLESEPSVRPGEDIPARGSAAAQNPAAPAAFATEEKLGNERDEKSSSVSELRRDTVPEAIPRNQIIGKTALADADGNVNKSTDKKQKQFTDSLGAKETPKDELTGDKRELEFAATQTAPQDVGQMSKAAEKPVADGSGGDFPAQAGRAFDFLAYYQQTDNLQFQPASGYWANTYIPGDPEIRWLSARLAQWDRSWLQNHGELEQSVTPVGQPFDAPDDNALSLSLMADASAVMPGGAGRPTRMRLQVGIRGIEHRHGQRPAMNVGVVIDLPADAPDEVRIAGRALLDAMLQSQQAGDRFSLVVTGEPGLIVEADDFRFGTLQLARQVILGQDTPQPQRDGAGPESSDLDRANIDLYGAIERAGAMVRQNDDPGRPLGSSAVLLISGREMANLGGLLALTHQHAKAGITLSVFPLGEHAQREQADQLALAGLGNRRFLEAPNQARRLIEEELHASSRAVARAARLSIRLAPGVKLIGVVGSERLDTERAQQVRDIENSMDRRLSANLGIQADRGVDEEGIQILIPTIYSADNVTVLLDVITDRPGAIADVSLRYKDLVFLRNGNLQGHLELPEGELKRGPAELAVLKNLLSHHFVIAVRQAAAALSRQQVNQAAGILRAMRNTIEHVRQTVPGWSQDPDLIHDQQVLDQYISALTSPEAGAHLSFLTDSLQYAAWAKTHRGLEEWK